MARSSKNGRQGKNATTDSNEKEVTT